MKYQSALLSVAPMMKYTNRFLRTVLRKISSETLLYTEMVTANAIKHADPRRFLEFDQIEDPLVLQLGGDDPDLMAEAAAIAADFGYRELNINVGCPSDRVQSGNFGACLMASPSLVGDMVHSMQKASGLPVSVKTRIGIDDHDDYKFLYKFVHEIRDAGCGRVIVHARKAILEGLSPAENRNVPPLNYDRVYQLKRDFPELMIEINGGVRDYKTVNELLKKTDGVMIGRAVTDDPWFLSSVDELFYGKPRSSLTQKSLVLSLLDQVDQWQREDISANLILHPFLLLFKGIKGGRMYRRYLSEHRKPTSSLAETIRSALEYIEEAEGTGHSQPQPETIQPGFPVF